MAADHGGGVLCFLLLEQNSGHFPTMFEHVFTVLAKYPTPWPRMGRTHGIFASFTLVLGVIGIQHAADSDG